MLFRSGRIADDTDVDYLAAALVGGVHLLFTQRGNTPPDPAAISRIVTTVLAGAQPLPPS